MGSNQQFYNKSREDILNKYVNSGRSKSTGKIEFDSLYRAEEEFAKQKLRNPLNFSNQVVK